MGVEVRTGDIGEASSLFSSFFFFLSFFLSFFMDMDLLQISIFHDIVT